MREIVRILADGDNISITPDGPRGPSQVAAKGAVTVAKLAQKPIIPATFSDSRCIRLGSWDRFMLALPFGRIALVVGAPVMADANEDADAQGAYASVWSKR